MNDKVLADLQAAIRTDRLRKQSLEKEVAVLTRKKQAVLNETEKIRQLKMGLLADIKELNGEKDGLRARITMEINALNDQRETVREQQNEVEFTKKEAEKILAEAKGIEKTNKTAHENLKSERGTLADAQKCLAKDRAGLDLEKKSVAQAIRDNIKTKATYTEKLDGLATKEKAVIQNLDKAKELRELLRQRISDTDRERAKLRGEVEKQLDLQQQTEALNEEMKRIIEKEAELDRMKESLAKTIAEQNKKDTEIEIRRLRVVKMAREKDVARELSELEKELCEK